MTILINLPNSPALGIDGHSDPSKARISTWHDIQAICLIVIQYNLLIQFWHVDNNTSSNCLEHKIVLRDSDKNGPHSRGDGASMDKSIIKNKS